MIQVNKDADSIFYSLNFMRSQSSSTAVVNINDNKIIKHIQVCLLEV